MARRIDRLTIAIVYRTGGEYDAGWVWAIKRQIEKFFPGCGFICLTNSTEFPYEWVRPLLYNWRGWWSKFELFRPGLFQGPVLYFDLDTLLVGEEAAELGQYRGELALLGDLGGHGRPQTGVMAFHPGRGTLAGRVWDLWMRNPDDAMRTIRGDGEWFMYEVLQHKTLNPEILQELYPGRIFSFKYHAREGVPEGAGVICGHGMPRFNQEKAGWAHTYWKDLDSPIPRIAEPGPRPYPWPRS